MLEYVPFQAFFLKKLTSRAFIFPVPPILPRRPPDGAERYGSTVPCIHSPTSLGTIVQQFVQRGSSYVAETTDAAEDIRHVVGFV